MNIQDFDYTLPKEFIAQSPANPRESAKLMVLHRKNKTIEHRLVSDLPEYFSAGDVVVVNNTKVFHARLRSGNKELFLLKPAGANEWQAIGRNIHPGMHIAFADDFTADILRQDKNIYTVSFNQRRVIDYANTYGEIPIPPYLKTLPEDRDYQTSYAKVEGSVAAPTAGFHLTKNIRSQLTKKRVEILEITLHVGLGTFIPVKTQTIEEHVMHSEWVDVPSDVAKKIATAKKEHRRTIAIGTTTTRALEGTNAQAHQGDVNLFIKPGFKFHIVDAMLTNFHLPKSTLIVLVSAFADRIFILKAYNEAMRHNYRFYSFGDAMLIF